jgi:hypothetical protein
LKKVLHAWSKRWAAARRIAWLSLAASVVAFIAAICATGAQTGSSIIQRGTRNIV